MGGSQSTGNKGGDREGRGLDWDPETSLDYFSYEEMKLDGLRYLCNIPRVDNGNTTTTESSDAENDAARDKAQEEEKKEKERKEVARATDRGLKLLQEMEGNCMYYVSGWWSYSFCYKNQVKQFHARSGPGVPNYPPLEDQNSLSFVLGKFEHDDDEEVDSSSSSRHEAPEKTNTAELQTKGESRYLVQKLGGGTICDLTGAERKVEVQFHCHPQSSDRIGWIKEITTCSYLMVIYTPRLCHDVAFQLPQPEDIHAIQCREILAPEEVEDFEAMKAHHASQKLLLANSGAATKEPQIVGGIEVGAMRQVGTKGKVMERGRMAKIGEESIQIVAQREGDVIMSVSTEELKRFELDPKEIEALLKKLEDMSNGNDWKLEVVENNGDRVIRAIVDQGDDDEDGDDDATKRDAKQDATKKGGKSSNKKKEAPKDDPPDQERGSEETFKDEL